MLITIKYGKVVAIIDETKEIQILSIEIEGEDALAINYPSLTGIAREGDSVQINTTAVELGLGSGGYHFVIAIINRSVDGEKQIGHIMKLRYTPHQIKILAVEEKDSPYHQNIKEFISLNHKPVIIGFLHSALLPCIAGIRAINPNLRISYIMTDGGALPIAFSQTVKKLQEMDWLEATITVGHAFGGDLEAINIYSGLAAASNVQNADIIVVAMGPGIVGTGTELGTTALEVGQIINAVGSLEGQPIVIPRINFQDQRERHYGLSHHTITVLKRIALIASTLVLPELNDITKQRILKQQLEKYFIHKKHSIIIENGYLGLDYLKKHNLMVHTMGKSINQEKEFFLAACAAGTYVAKLM